MPGRGAGAEMRARPSVANVTNWAGAAVSLALIAGVGVWGYKLVSRDVSGVPVVMALEGPMRVAPENPGGQLADHQGLAVNAVAGEGVAAAPADRLVLAPRPAGLSEEDVALGVLAPLVQAEASRQSPIEASLRVTAEIEDAESAAALDDDVIPDLTDDAALTAFVERMAAGATPLSELAPGETPPPVTALADTEIVPPEMALGLSRSLRPQLRPSGLRTASLTAVTPEIAAAVAAAQQGGTREIDPASLPEGTRLVQIGTFKDADAARAEWRRLETRFSAFLEGKSRVIQRASSGGRVFYRLRAEGFADLSDARRFCAEFVAANVDCIPVVTR
ncbi:SPOR domain-containing protein [Cognatishimia sp. F0-27]|nr:SPOR domain-containing protein [Cognatishimia sp. F0-27]